MNPVKFRVTAEKEKMIEGMTVFNTQEVDTKKQPMFFGAPLGVQRYDTYKYPVFDKLTQQQLGYFWRPEEVSLQKDRADYQTLRPEQKHIFTSNLKYQILLDSVQGRGPGMAFTPYCSLPELEACMKVWEFMEMIHSRSYTYIIKNVYSDPTEVFDSILGDETFRQHSRETFSSLSPSERRSRTASVLKKMKELNANVEKPKKKKKKKAVAEECGCEDDGKKVLAMMVIKKAIDAKKKKNSQLNSGIIGEESAAWQRKEGKNPEGGLNKKGIASYRRENPGSKLSLAVTTPPSKLKKGSKAAKRRKSFCARMSGMPGPMKDEKGRPTRKALSLRKWNC